MRNHLVRQWLVLLVASAAIGAGCNDNNEPGQTPGNTGTVDPDMKSIDSDMKEPPVEDMKTSNDTDMRMDAPDMRVEVDPDMRMEEAPDMRMEVEPDMKMEPTCEDECDPGALVCDSNNAYRVCGQYDQDPCLETSPPINCAQGYECDEGRCVTECRDECPLGGTLCADEQTVRVCGNFDQDACTEGGGDVSCPADQRCEQGACVPNAQACTDECATAGETICFGDTVRTCGDFDSDSCLDLGAPEVCALGQACEAGQCIDACVDECPAQGATECVGDAVRTCGNLDQDSCLEWSAPSACRDGEACSAGQCAADCTDECDAAGGAVCSPDGSGVSLCGSYDSDACLDRSSAIPCPAGTACQNGICVASCTNECTPGASRCDGTGTSIETCGDFDADPCYEFGGAVACPGGAACNQDACDVPCADECTTAGDSECTPTGPRTCGQYDLDQCLEWSTSSACEAWEICTTGTCELGATPASILINEFSYDSIGRDTDPDNTIFIELWGPAGESLDGWAITGIDGNTGNEVNRISLDGEVIGADGYFVVAHPQSDPILIAASDITDSDADMQNGPDTVVLEWRGRKVDAVAYGSFGAGQTNAGEGSPASTTGPGESLSRDASHTDTDDNSADFSVVTIPTPRGVLLGCVDECQMQGAAQCAGDQIQTCGDYDADSCLELGPPADCAVAGEVCQGGVCAPPCMNECPSQGATQCLGDQVITCGNYDADTCLEWSPSSACPTAGQVCVVDQCQSADAPEVVLITPQGIIQTTQGNMHRILVDPTPSAGRTISQVDFYANNVLIGTTNTAPHEVNYTIPAATPTGQQIQLQARATDSVGEVGASQYATLDVQNDIPVASFTATITNTTTVTVDASASTDTETDASALEVCWDWDDDGSCDTGWSTDKIANHDYGASGVYTVRMKIRDPQGQIAESTRQVSFMDIQYIGGTSVMTTLWYGTIIVTGDITVPAGQTLTIASGTQVLFVNADVDAPIGVGDYKLDIQGQLIVQGTAAEPVVFTGQDMAAKTPGGWERIELNGATPSTIEHAIIEYADIGLDISNGSTLTDVTVRKTSSECVLLTNADNATLTRVTISECGKDGVRATSGSTGVVVDTLVTTNNGESGLNIEGSSSLTVTTSTSSGNGGDGVRVDDSTLALSGSTLDDNSQRGLHYLGGANGTATQNQIHTNKMEGVGLFTTSDGSPSPTIQRNNIYSNAVTGSTNVELADAGISTSFTCCSTSGSTSSAYTAPAGKTIRRVRVNFQDGSDRSQIDGYLLDGTTNAILRSFESDFNGWVYVPDGVTSIKVRVRDTGYSYATDTIAASDVELVDSVGASDVVAAIDSGTVNMRKNYLGVFPDVLSRISQSPASALDLQGFTGVLYDTTTWDSGPYYGGEDLMGTNTWSGTIYVTGNLYIPAGSVLDVAPGTSIEFVAHDQNGDGDGDFSVDADGQFNLNGAQGNEISVGPFGTPLGAIYQTITLAGSGMESSTWQDAVMSQGKVAVTITGSPALTRVAINNPTVDGVFISAGNGATLDLVEIDQAMRHGVWVDSATSTTIADPDIRNSGEHGIYVTDGATPAIADGTIRDNDGHGVAIVDASPSVDYCNITYNGLNGLYFAGSTNATTSYNVIKFNGDSGVGVWTTNDGNPTPTIEYSNIYGNAVSGVTLVELADAGISTSFTCCSTSGSTSSAYTAPAGKTIRRVRVNFQDGSDRSQIDGYLLDGTTNAILRSFESDFNGWVYVPDGVTSIKVRVRDTGYSYATDTIAASDVELVEVDPMASYELTAYTDSGTTTAKFNYWTPTIGDVPNRIYQSRAGSVDYTGFTGAEYTNAGPRP